MLPLPHGRTFLVIGWILVALTIAGSLAPKLPQPGLTISDKLMHFWGYFGLTLWFAGLYPRRRLWIVGFGFLLLGGGLEVLQGTLTRHRQMDVHDLVMNSLGIVAAVAFALLGLSHWAVRLESWLTRRADASRERG